MQVRDVIKELERFEPTAEVSAEVCGNEGHGVVQKVETAQGEPVLIVE